MKEIFTGIAEFLNIPAVRAILSIVLIIDVVYMVSRLQKVLKQPDPDLYKKANLEDICFGLNVAIDEYSNHYSDEDLKHCDDFKRLVALRQKVCTLLCEYPDGSKLKK